MPTGSSPWQCGCCSSTHGPWTETTAAGRSCLLATWGGCKASAKAQELRQVNRSWERRILGELETVLSWGASSWHAAAATKPHQSRSGHAVFDHEARATNYGGTHTVVLMKWGNTGPDPIGPVQRRTGERLGGTPCMRGCISRCDKVQGRAKVNSRPRASGLSSWCLLTARVLLGQQVQQGMQLVIVLLSKRSLGL